MPVSLFLGSGLQGLGFLGGGEAGVKRTLQLENKLASQGKKIRIMASFRKVFSRIGKNHRISHYFDDNIFEENWTIVS